MCNIMLEDSITSSPSKANKSIRESRLKRKSKRKKADQSVQIDSDHEQSVTGFHNLLNEFYYDSDTQPTEIVTKSKNSPFLVTPPSAIISNFKPFELEKSLAMADHMITPKSKPSIFVESQGFVACSSLPKASSKIEYFKNGNEENGENSSYIITESELLICCHQVEKILQNVTPKKQDNPKLIVHKLTPDENDNMNLVNSILNDFSQSPLGREQIVVNTSWQYTPEFRLRRQPVKCYSRKCLNNTKTNLNQLFEKHSTRDSSEYDDDSSSCSSLSVQEDVTVGEKLNTQLPITNTNNTQRLCENLLNLSEYFTQNQSLSDEEQDTCDLNLFTNNRDNLLYLHNMPDLINDVLTLRSIYPNKERHDSYNSINSFYGFPNKEDDKNYSVDADSSEHDMLNESLNITRDFNVCDNRVPNLTYEEDNPALYDWQEDDCHDIFACINTDNVLQHHFNATPNDEMGNIEETALPKMVDNNDNFMVLENSNQNYAFSNSIGFKTASSKPIKVSREAQTMAAKILSKLPDISKFKENDDLNNCDTTIINKDVNLFENSEDYEWNDDCDLFLNIQTPVAFKKYTETKPKQQHSASELLTVTQREQEVPSTSKIATLGFKTAGGSNVHISKKAQKSVQKLLHDFASDLNNDIDYEEELREIKCKTYEKTHNLESKQSTLSDIKQLNKNQGFKTVNGNNKTNSMTVQQNVKNIFNEFCRESKQNFYEDFEMMKNNEVKQSISAINGTYKEFQAAQDEVSIKVQPDKNDMRFHKADNKITNTPTKAKQSAQKLLEEYNKSNKEGDMLSDIKSLRNYINKRNGKQSVAEINTNIFKTRILNENKEDFNNVVLSERRFEQFIETDTNEEPILFKMNNEKGNPSNKEQNLGFQTANGKQVLISAKAQQSVEQILQEFKTVLDIERYETDLKEMKTKIQIKNKQFEPNKIQEDNENANTTINPRPSESNKVNLTNQPINGKRNMTTDNSGSESPNRTPAKIFKNNLYCSKSSFAEQSLKSPLASTSHTLIVRKNLLTLTKRRKSKRNSLIMPTEEIPKVDKEIYDINMNAATPIKSCIPLRDSEQTPATPNLTEFFSKARQTSTPRINISPKSQPSIEDLDLKPIIWKNNDSISNKSAGNSGNTTKLSDNLAINITLNSSNPTAKERIGRLKMYGKAPAVSPILIETHHNCRPSGLRRTRSMLKRTEK